VIQNRRQYSEYILLKVFRQVKNFLALAAMHLLLNATPLHAAPLDPLMSSRHTTEPWHGELEISIDNMNDTLDLFDMRGGHEDFAGTSVGDYSGGHLQGGVAITEQLWLEGSWWDRTLDYRTEAFNLQSWHLSTQYLLNESVGLVIPELALRVGVWGNQAELLSKKSATTLFGRKVDNIDIHSPQDRQWQLDLIGTWGVAQSTELTLFVGGGQISTSFDKLTASGAVASVVDINSASDMQKILDNRDHPMVAETINTLLQSTTGLTEIGSDTTITVKECADGQCTINIRDPIGLEKEIQLNMAEAIKGKQFNQLEIALSADPDSDKISIQGIDLLENSYGLDSGLGIAHDGDFYQIGGGLTWYNQGWRVRGGYKLLYVDRSDYEEVVRNFGASAEKINNVFIADITRRVGKHGALFIRGYAMTNQFLGEIPFSYTPYTAHRFDERYGFVSAGYSYYF